MIFQAIDHIIIAVGDLDAATAAHRTLLGRAPSWRGTHAAFGTRNTLFRLDNTYIELLAALPRSTTPQSARLREALGDSPERPFGLAIRVNDLTAAINILRGRGMRLGEASEGAGEDERSGRRRTWRSAWIDPASSGGLRLLLIQHTCPAHLLPRALGVADDAAVCLGVDHVVISSSDLNASVRLWTEGFRITEQWRRDFPERGTRNVGLDFGGITVELIMRTDQLATGIADRFWGVAYQVFDCSSAVARLRAAGLQVDNPRAGLAPDTQVASVRWPRTPTLVIQRRLSPPTTC
ncbi:MAG: VOC family protein [Deltaproteobacteria bacterium]|nr:VOC family protein [Deltaproteobacteria bacterium]